MINIKKIPAALCAIILCITLVVASLPAFASPIDSTIGRNLIGSNWMSGIKDNTLISDISIPGTHDSGARVLNSAVSKWAKCQNLTISEQLSIGVRYLDMRLQYDTTVAGNIGIVHSDQFCYTGDGNGKLTLSAVLNDVYNFLDNNPTETVLVSLKQDSGNNESSIVSEIRNRINENSKYWYVSSATPTIGNTRGKIILTSRLGQLQPSLYLNWGDQGGTGTAVQDKYYLKVQDRYEMDRDAKWNDAVKPFLNETKPDGMFFINFLSTTKGGALGLDGPETNAGYINGWFNSYELKNNKCYGIVVFDFVNERLANRIYQCNDLVSKTQADPSKGQYYFRANMNTTSAISAGNWNFVVLKLYYKTNNGTGVENSITLFEKNSYVENSYIYVTDNGNYDFSGVVNGFPTRLQFTYYFTGGGNLVTQQKLYVGKDAASTLTEVASNNFDGPAGNNSENYNSSSDAYPHATTISFTDSSSITLTAPPVGGADVTYNLDSAIYDQYGVLWYQKASSYKFDNTYTGVSMSGNVLKISQYANNNSGNINTYIKAYYDSGTTHISTSNGRYLYVSKWPIPYSFVNYDGKVLYSSNANAGTTPVYNGNTPVKPSDNKYHYTFSGWSPLIAPLTVEKSKFTALFSAELHSSANSVTENQVEATLKTDGSYDTVIYCSKCGHELSRETTVIDAFAKEQVKRYKNTVAAADAIDLNKYGQDAAASFTTAYNEAVSLYDNATTAEEIDRATEVLVAAISSLDNYIADFTALEKAYQDADAFLLGQQDKENPLYAYNDVKALNDLMVEGKVFLDMDRDTTLKNLYQLSIDKAASDINQKLESMTVVDTSAFLAAFDAAVKYDKDIYNGSAVETANNKKDEVFAQYKYTNKTLYTVDEEKMDFCAAEIIESLNNSIVVYSVTVSDGIEIAYETKTSDGTYQIPYGKEITLSTSLEKADTAWYMTYVSNTTQRDWMYQASGKQYKMKVLGNIKITAKSRDTQNYKVELVRCYDTQDTHSKTDRIEYVDSSYTLPVPAGVQDYRFIGYLVDSNTEYLQPGTHISVTKDTVIKMMYEYAGNMHNVTINDINGNPVSTNAYPYNAMLQISCDEPDFAAFLEKTGENSYRVFSYDRNVTLYVVEEMTLEPATSERLQELGIDTTIGFVNLSKTAPKTKDNRTVFNAQYILPKKADLIEYGLLVGIPVDGPIKEEDLILENVGVPSCYLLKRCKSTKHTPANQFVIGYSNPRIGLIYKGYLIYQLNGEVITVYSELGVTPENLPGGSDMGDEDVYG